MDTKTSETTAATPAQAGALLTKAQLAAYLQLTPRSIENFQRRGMPFYRLGARRNRFDIASVRAWLDKSCRIVRVN